MQPTTMSFFIGGFVVAVIAAFVSAESDHQEDLREFRTEQYTRRMYGSSDTNN